MESPVTPSLIPSLARRKVGGRFRRDGPGKRLDRRNGERPRGRDTMLFP